MSENTNKETIKQKKNDWITNFIWVIIGAVIGIILGYTIFVGVFKKQAADAINDIQNTENSGLVPSA